VALIPEGEDEIAALSQPLFLPAVRPELAPVVYSVPLHLFSYHFAKARFARSLGHVPASQPCAA
jgi:glucosamine 6-phosphate synthetase-like amidotransferase/phosphosugar isomerase protein